MSDLTPLSIDIPKVAPESTEKLKQTAQVLFQRCIQVLKQEFGATEVIVYGSLRGDSPWHDESDVDLAVSGIPSKEIWDASSRLEEIMPEWLPFDLVRLETVDARVGRRILQTAPFPKDKYLSLKLHLEDKIAVIESSADKINKTLAQIDTVSASLLTPVLARYLEGFYGRCEKLAKRVAVSLDGGRVPKGSKQLA